MKIKELGTEVDKEVTNPAETIPAEYLTKDSFVKWNDMQSIFKSKPAEGIDTLKATGPVRPNTMRESAEHDMILEHINSIFANSEELKSIIPIKGDLFEAVKDGVILSKLINHSCPGTIDERVINFNPSKKLTRFQMVENNNLVVNSAKAIGCTVVNIGAIDLVESREHLVLGIIWQIIKAGLQSKVDIKVHPELFRLFEPGESLEAFLKLPVEHILLRWFNYHLNKAGHPQKIKNFSTDLKNGEFYTILLHQLKPLDCSRTPLETDDLLERAEQILENADKIGCRKYLTSKCIVEGNANHNFAFIANLFNTWSGLEKLSENVKTGLDKDLKFESEGDREARVFVLWLNSLVSHMFVLNLCDDLQDGLMLLYAMDKIRPGIVEWNRVNQPAPLSSKWKKIENCNYVVTLGQKFKFSLPGIQGSDLNDGNKKLTLGLCWQLMRENVVTTLKALSQDGKEISDADMIAWANASVEKSGINVI